MKNKLELPLIILTGLGMAFYIACEKGIFTPEKPGNVFIIKTEADSIEASIATSRAGDGKYDFVILLEGFKGQDVETGFRLADSAVAAIKGTSPFMEGDSIVRFWIKNVKSAIKFSYINSGDGVSLMYDVPQTVKQVGSIPMDRVIILGNGKGHGGNYGQVITVGLGNQAGNSFCTFFQSAFWGKLLHELVHSFVGQFHINFPGNKLMSCTNFCCEVWNKPILPEHQTIIINNMQLNINP